MSSEAAEAAVVVAAEAEAEGLEPMSLLGSPTLVLGVLSRPRKPRRWEPVRAETADTAMPLVRRRHRYRLPCRTRPLR